MKKKKLYLIGIIIIAVAAVAVLIFIGKSKITGFAIFDKQNQTISANSSAVLRYGNNLEVDGITMPDGSLDLSQVFLISSLEMQGHGNKVSSYTRVPSVRKKTQRSPTEIFDAFYYNDPQKEYWIVKYLEKYEPYNLCNVKLKYDGQLVSLDCVPQAPTKGTVNSTEKKVK